MELPRLQPLYEKYRDQGFEVIAIETKGQTERATKFIEENGLTYTMLKNGEGEAEVASATLAYNQEQIRLEALQEAVEGLHYRNAP